MEYWVKFDPDGEIIDYSYYGGSDAIDFIWTQHVKKDEPWTGMSQADGVKNADIQRLYFASQGRLDSHTLAGGFISSGNLTDAQAAPQPQ
jgi:hypothetical protein